jgi:hypothetical protein
LEGRKALSRLLVKTEASHYALMDEWIRKMDAYVGWKIII